MYGKLINNTLRRAPDKVQYNGNTILNPPDAVLLELGYLPVTYTDMPEDTSPSGPYYEPHWEQTETEIVRVWAEVEPPETLEPEPTIADLEAAIKEAINSD